MNVQVMLCGCGRRLEATHYEALVAEVREHLRADHPELRFGEAGVRVVREIVAARSYRVEEGGRVQEDAGSGVKPDAGRTEVGSCRQ